MLCIYNSNAIGRKQNYIYQCWLNRKWKTQQCKITTVGVGRNLCSPEDDVKVEDIREATADEIQHGHAHGIGGHQH